MRKFTQKALSLLTLACLGSQAQAVGLGNIEVNSKLNQPLNARIKLMSIPRQDMQNLGNVKVRLASAEAFKRAGLERPVVLSELRFNVEGSGETSADIRISSSQPIKEPFVNFLLEVDWPNGRILREYTVLLDPPLYKAESPAPVAAPKASTSEESDAPVKSKKVVTSRPSTAPLPEDVPVTGETHTVKKGESLAGIANKMRSGTGVSQREMMQAILDANPDAFINRNINRLRSGVVLQTPSIGGEPSDQNAVAVTNKAQLSNYQEQTAEAPETAPITTAPAPKKAPPLPKPAVIKRPLEISGASDEGTGSGSKGEVGQLRQQIQEVIEENKRIQQENKALKEDIAATKQLVESMKGQIDALIKVQNDTLARLEQQTKGGQTAGATVAAITPKVEPPKTEVKSDTIAKTDVKPEEIKPDAAKTDLKKDDWGDKPKTETKSDTSITPETLVKTDIKPVEVKKDDWSVDSSKTETKSDASTTPETLTKTDVKPVEVKKDDWNVDSSKTKTEIKSDSWSDPHQKPDQNTTVTQVTDPAKKPEETKPIEGEQPKVTPVATQTPQPIEEPSILDSALIMASDVGNMADNAVSAVPGGWMTVGGGLGVPLLAGLGWGAYRRRRDEKQSENEELTDEELDELLQDGKDEFCPCELNLDDSFTELDGTNSAFIASDEVLDEVDVYVEYERYDQALETLNHALDQRPDHEPYLIKRLEIDAATSNTKAFEEHAQALYRVSGEQSDNWQKAQSLWSGISHKPLNIKESSFADKTEKESSGMGLGTMAAVGLGAAGLAAAGLAAAGAFDGDGESESAGGGEFESLNLNNLEENGEELDFSSLDASDASDMDFNLSSMDENETQTLDMDSLNLGEETDISNTDTMNFDQDFNLGEESTSFESMTSSDEEDMNFLLNQDDSNDLNLHEETASESLNLDTPAHQEIDLSMNLDEDMSLDDFNLGESLEETPVSEPIATSSPVQEEDDMSFLLDDSGLDLGLSEEEPAAELKPSEPEKPAETDLTLGDDFLLDDSGLDLGIPEEEPAAVSFEETHGGGESSQENFIDDVSLDDFGSDLTGGITEEQTFEETPEANDEFALDDSFNMDLNTESTDDLSLDSLSEETPQQTNDEFALDDSFNMDLNTESTDDLSLDSLSEETPQQTNDEFALDDSFNMDLNTESTDDLSLDSLSEETPQQTNDEFALDDSFNMDLNTESTDDLSLDSLSEETPQQTNDEFALDDSFNMDLNAESTDDLSLDSLSEETPQQTNDEFALDDSFNMDLNAESTDDLSLDSLSEETPQQTNDEFALDDSFNLDMGNLEEENTASLEMPTISNAEEEFKLDDDFSDFNLSSNDDPNANDGLDLSLSADEQALLGDDFNMDLNNDFNLDMGDDFEGKFDLVQAYLESDDIASAQSTLEEIVNFGTPDQQARAKEVLDELGLV
jgi:pilus assembly protein FimV